MLGAIIGDIAGSRFEFNNIHTKNFELFAEDCQATDDSIMTLAVAKAIMACNGNWEQLGFNTVKYMQKIGRKYPNCGFGGMFRKWMFSGAPEPYNSFGNGAAMRVSPCGFIAGTEKEAILLSRKVTEVTHNHPEGLKGAEAVTVAIFMARNGAGKNEIKERIEKDYYDLNFTLDSIRDNYQFNETCQETVPQAIAAFLESASFEDAIRGAVSLGGDSDTLAAITGSIAEAFYGVPSDLKKEALGYLDRELLDIYEEWEKYKDNNKKNEITTNPEYENLLSIIRQLETELADLVYDRDKLLYHTCPQIQTEYMLSIGKLEYAVFEYQCKILRTKRKIEIIQSCLNREQPYDITEIEKQLDKEYHEYTERLLEKQKEIENARFNKSNYGKPLTDEETSELKKLYTLIVKKLHPDINPDTTEEQHAQFINAVNAYKNTNLSELRIIYLLLDKISVTETENTMDKLKSRKEILFNEKEYMLNEIQRIKDTFPYTVKDLLQDKAEFQRKIDEVSKLLTEYQEQYNNIEDKLKNMLK